MKKFANINVSGINEFAFVPVLSFGDDADGADAGMMMSFRFPFR